MEAALFKLVKWSVQQHYWFFNTEIILFSIEIEMMSPEILTHMVGLVHTGQNGLELGR